MKKEKKHKKLIAILAVVVVVVVIAVAAGFLLGTDFGPFNAAVPHTEQVVSGSGDTIGTRMIVQMDKGEAQKATQSEFRAWVEKYVTSDYQWVTVDFGDGTGLVFAGGGQDIVEYGTIDDLGRISSLIDTYIWDGSGFIKN